MTQEAAHSPKGGSSAERWINCPGSAVILKELNLPQTDEPEYRSLGTSAHSVGERCLKETIDTWEVVGEQFGEHVCDDAMATAVQTYLDYVRPKMRQDGMTTMVEKRIGEDASTRPHPDFYGTVDCALYGPEELEVIDYKHGEGIVVEPEQNAQMMYYAYGILHDRIQRGVKVDSRRLVRLTIVQPRAFHLEGPIRSWETTAGEIIHWGETVLLPAMQAAEIDQDFDAGKWCRFCPAKLFCPLLSGIFGAAAKADPKAIPNFGQKRLALEYAQRDAVKFYMKAVDDEVHRRNMLGNTVPDTKLVQKMAHRVFRDGAQEVFYERFGTEAFTKPSLKSPADMEKVSPAAKKLVAEWAYTPNTGLTTVPASDKKLEVKVEKAADIFAHMIPADETNGEAHE